MGRREGPRAKRGRFTVVIAIAAGIVLAAAALILFVPRAAAPPAPRVAAVTLGGTVRRETRPTLDPALFAGKAAAAYRIAREIPDVLDQLTCYCACGSEYGHVSLLSCYTDGHGST
jgi:hypothetical protein